MSDGVGDADKVIPLHYFDDTPLWRAVILYSLFVFDRVLDTKKLAHNLERLITHQPGWQKLGARLRRNKVGGLEYHIPVFSTTHRPALAYTHVEYETNVGEHPVASRLPRMNMRTKPAVFGNLDDFLSLMMPPDSPRRLSDYLNKDIPQLGLHIVSFKDTTLVSLYWPHTLMDAMGKKTLLDAWSLMIQGREDEVVAPYGVNFDPLAELGTKHKEQHKLITQKMGMLGLVGYALRQIPEFFREQENRMVCIPRSFLAKLLQEAMIEISAAGQGEVDGRKAFLSEGDVLCAWWTRLAITHLPAESSQTVVLNNAFDLRKPLQSDRIPESKSYVSNAVGFINVLMPVKDIVEKPLSYVASCIRKAINELGTSDQVESYFSMVRQRPEKVPPFFGDMGMHMITYSNWTKAKLFEVDFSAAAVGGGRMGCRPRYIQNNQFGLILPNGFPIIGKDGDGNYWLSGYMNRNHWEKIESLLARESQQ